MTLVDSNVLLDVIADNGAWFAWSAARLDEAASAGVIINPVIYAEIAPAFASMSDLDTFVTQSGLAVTPFPRESLFEAGVVHARYRANGGQRERVLPDFLIGAQAAVTGCALLTRDARRYRTYFPGVRLITP